MKDQRNCVLVALTGVTHPAIVNKLLKRHGFRSGDTEVELVDHDLAVTKVILTDRYGDFSSNGIFDGVTNGEKEKKLIVEALSLGKSVLLARIKIPTRVANPMEIIGINRLDLENPIRLNLQEVDFSRPLPLNRLIEIFVA